MLSSLRFSPPVITALSVLKDVADDGLTPDATATAIDCTRMDVSSGLPTPSIGGSAALEITGSNFGANPSHVTVTVHGVHAPLLLLRDNLIVVRTALCAGA